jgi:hypothetical protein
MGELPTGRYGVSPEIAITTLVEAIRVKDWVSRIAFLGAPDNWEGAGESCAEYQVPT